MRAALAFLTVIPSGCRPGAPGRWALAAFPLVGALIGGVWSLSAWGATQAWGPLVAAGGVLLADLLITGGLHLDAVADLADGLASRRPPRQAIEIMREPAIGAIGAAGLVTALLLRFSLIATLSSSGHWIFLALPPVAARAGMVWTMARSGRVWEGSMAASLSSVADVRIVAVAIACGLLLGWVLGGTAGLAATVVTLILAEAWRHFFLHRFGSLTGDVIGAYGVAAEIFVLAMVAGL